MCPELFLHLEEDKYFTRFMIETSESTEVHSMKTFKKLIVPVLVIMLMLAACLPVSAANYNDTSLPLYVVESFVPNGYCYLYSQASSSSTNQGDHQNGEYVRLIRNDGDWCYVVCSNGKEGFIKSSCLTPAAATVTRDVYRVYSTSPSGYCYLYDKAGSTDSRNLGQYNNGEYLVIVNWNADPNYAAVMSPSTGKYGYVRKGCIIPAGEYR